jgi:hypothetical protein
MTIFSTRKKAFEQRFKHEQDLRFQVTARRNRLFGEWAADRLGLSPAAKEIYAKSVVQAQFEEPGVLAKVDGDLRARGVAATESELRSELARFTREARRQIADAGMHHAHGAA